MKDIDYKYRHALIIDDSKMDILFLKEILSSTNYASRISTFENPTVAFNFLKKCEKLPELIFPDIIFIDLYMPGMSGFKFIESCSNEFNEPLRFIIVSSSSQSADLKKSNDYPNVLQYFIKPINKSDLLALH